MEIYFKKLTDDLIEVCRMLDDNPEAKTRLSEIAFDVSVLPSVGYAFGKWTTTPPTVSGYYWMRVKSWYKGNKYVIDMGDIEVHDGVINFSYPVSGYEYEDDYRVEDVTHWLGPLPVPAPPTE